MDCPDRQDQKVTKVLQGPKETLALTVLRVSEVLLALPVLVAPLVSRVLLVVKVQRETQETKEYLVQKETTEVPEAWVLQAQ